MGLLDLVNDDGFRLGLGIFAAGGARSDGAGIGQRLAEGVGSLDAFKANKEKQKFMQMQMDNYASEIEARKLAAVKDARMQDMIGKMIGDSGAPSTGQSSGAYSPSVDGMGPVLPQSTGAQGSGGIMGLAKQLGLPPEAIQSDMVFNGGKKISEMLANRSEPKWQNMNGNLVNTNAPGFSGGLQAGMNASANGQVTAWQPDGRGGLVVGAPTGAIDTARAYSELGAGLKPIKVYNPETGREEYANELQVARGGNRPQNIQSSGYAGGDRSSANAESLRMMQSELERLPATHPDAPAIRREMQRLMQQSGATQGTPQSVGYAAGPSAQEEAKNAALKTGLVKTAEADVVRDTTKQADAKRFTQLMAGADEALNLLKSGPTNSGFGRAVDATAGFFGGSTNGADISAKLSTIGGWLTANVPRMEGPQSDRDVIQYKQMAGMVGDSNVPVSQRIAAVEAMKSMQQKYAGLNGYPASGDSKDTGDKPAAQAKTISLADIAETARRSGKTTAEVTAAARSKGYTIGGQ